jgi:hypothetical protein
MLSASLGLAITGGADCDHAVENSGLAVKNLRN